MRQLQQNISLIKDIPRTSVLGIFLYKYNVGHYLSRYTVFIRIVKEKRRKINEKIKEGGRCMNWSLFVTFCILNVFNVIIQTIKSIATIKCNKYIAALINAVAYGLYTVVLVYMVCELPLWLKVIVISIANLIGVFIVKICEEKARKDKLWRLDATVHNDRVDILIQLLKQSDLKYSKIKIDGNESGIKCTEFHIYCPESKDTHAAKTALAAVKAKYFITETI